MKQLNRIKRDFYFLSLMVIIFAGCSKPEPSKRQLIVSMYPEIPNSENYYQKVEKQFEEQNPNIDLIINLNDDYYDEKNGIVKEEADVYELDCILLKDFISSHKIQSFPSNFELPDKDTFPAAHLVYQENKLYAVPHWLCGNFLFYKKTDSVIRDVKKLKDLEMAIGTNPTISQGLLIDLKGRLTLGEIYADGLLDEYKSESSVKEHSYISSIDNKVIANLNRLPALTFATWGRLKDYHSRRAFYQKQFAKGNGRAFVGYSESLYYILNEINNSSAIEEIYLNHSNIAVNEVPLSDNGSTPIGWVDALTLNSKLSGQKLEDALTFITYCVTSNCYHLALIPDLGSTPRYLLPAYKHYYNEDSILRDAPLYHDLLPLANHLISITNDSLCPSLRKIGVEIDLNRLKN